MYPAGIDQKDVTLLAEETLKHIGLSLSSATGEEFVKSLVQELIQKRVDAIAFTNEIQCRHLFRVADDIGLARPLALALNTDTIVAAIGPVCADSLQGLGVTPDVIPAQPSMGSMVTALAEYFELTEGLS